MKAGPKCRRSFQQCLDHHPGGNGPPDDVECEGSMGRTLDSYSASRKILPGFLNNGFVIAALAAALILLPAAAPPAFAADPAPSAADQNCLGCHGAAGMEKKLADGDTLQLHVPADAFVKSVHGPNGCTSCHADVDPAAHPPVKKDIASARSFAIATTQVCRTCHTDKFEQWESSIHGEQVPCKNCHSDIYTAYLGSVHGQSRLHSKDSYTPLCSGCHTAHAVQPIAVGALAQGPEGAC